MMAETTVGFRYHLESVSDYSSSNSPAPAPERGGESFGDVRGYSQTPNASENRLEKTAHKIPHDLYPDFYVTYTLYTYIAMDPLQICFNRI